MRVKKYFLTNEKKVRNQDSYLAYFFYLLTEPNNIDIGFIFDVADIIKAIMDPEFNGLRNDLFHTVFDKYLIKIVNAILDQESSSKKILDTSKKSILLDILVFCLKSYPIKTKAFIMKNDILMNLSSLFTSRSKQLKSSIIKLLRILVGFKDEAINKFLIKQNYFHYPFSIFIIDKKDNMIKSQILELFDFIFKNKQKSILDYISDEYSEYLKQPIMSNHLLFKNILNKVKYKPNPIKQNEIPNDKFNDSLKNSEYQRVFKETIINNDSLNAKNIEKKENDFLSLSKEKIIPEVTFEDQNEIQSQNESMIKPIISKKHHFTESLIDIFKNLYDDSSEELFQNPNMNGYSSLNEVKRQKIS